MTRHGKAPVVQSAEEGSSSTRGPDSVTVGTTQQSGQSQEEEITFAGETVGQIETLIESFRTGNSTKTQTIIKINQILAGEQIGDERSKLDSLERYGNILDSIQTLSAESTKHGQRFVDPILGKRKEVVGNRGERYEAVDGNTARDSNPIDFNDFVEKLSKKGSISEHGDSNSGGESDDDKFGDDEPDERGKSNKKQRIYESQMPWYSREQRIRRSNTNPSCNKTRETLDLFQRDHATVKRWIKCASSAPAGFPNTEWDALVKGETVDIDTVFSSLHHIHSIDESVGRVGATEIQFGRPKPAAKVETSGQWTAAFNLIIKATSFLFPHQYDELREYSDYMEELFSAKSIGIHPKLFKYDEAVRYKVGQGQNILLTDRSQFVRYYEAIVAADGVGIEATSERGQGSQGKSGKPRDRTDICHRFNGPNGCSSTAEKCKYKHICKKCKRRGHGKMDCKVDEGM